MVNCTDGKPLWKSLQLHLVLGLKFPPAIPKVEDALELREEGCGSHRREKKRTTIDKKFVTRAWNGASGELCTYRKRQLGGLKHRKRDAKGQAQSGVASGGLC